MCMYIYIYGWLDPPIQTALIELGEKFLFNCFHFDFGVPFLPFILESCFSWGAFTSTIHRVGWRAAAWWLDCLCCDGRGFKLFILSCLFVCPLLFITVSQCLPSQEAEVELKTERGPGGGCFLQQKYLKNTRVRLCKRCLFTL